MSNTERTDAIEAEKPADKVVSPKVVAQLVTGLVLTGVVAGVAALTPDHFAALGMWALPVYTGIVAIGGALAGYIVNDPRRV